MFSFGKKPTSQELEQQKALKVYREGVTTLRDIIAPSAMEVNFNHIRLGSYFLRSFFVYTYPRYLYTTWLSDIINADFEVDTSMYVYPVESKEIMSKLRTKVSQIESTYSEQRQKGMVRDPVLETAYQDVEELRDILQKGEAKFFKMSLYFTVYAKSLKELDDLTDYIESTLAGQLIFTKRAILQQEDCFNSTLPLSNDNMLITRNFDTAALSASFPFVSNELSNNEGILYGINMHNNSLILFDRFSLENANMVVLAKSGSGKSYAIKLEALRSMMLGTELIVIDPENEYEMLCSAVGGTFLNVSLNSEFRVNPFDLPSVYDKEASGEDVFRSNVIMLHGLVKLMVGGEMSALEDNILDQAIIETYASKGITSDVKTHNMTPPLMSDLEKVLASFEGGETLSEKLKKYTKGTFSGLFNQPTNINLDNKFIVFSIRDLEEELRPLAMYIILNFIWNRVKSERRRRQLIVEEAWIMMKYPESAQFVYSIAKRARKYYLGLTTISQDIDEFISSPYGRAIINNTSLSLLMKQHPSTLNSIGNVFNLTEAEKLYMLNCQVGEGLFFAGLNHVAVKVVASQEEDELITTNPQQLEEMEA